MSMKKILIICILVGVAFNCYSNTMQSIRTDTILKKTKFSMENGDRPDEEQATPSLTEEKKTYLESYNKIENIDTTLSDGKNVIHVKIKYYCIKKSTLIIPKKYNWAQKKQRAFITHDFASKVTVISNKDTVFDKVVLKSDFNNIISDPLKKYAILLSPNFSKFNKSNGEVVLQYSVSIPVTDIGTSVYLIINRKGDFKVLNNYK